VLFLTLASYASVPTNERSFATMTFGLFQGIGVPELLIVLGIVVVIFGPKRLPALGRQLGSGMREFRDAITRKSREDEAAEEPEPPALESPREPVAERDR
jgi:TatA/E family protein of Tat protein translocase